MIQGVVIAMNNLFQWLGWVVDLRQEHKIKHLMKDIIMIVFFAKIANADEWIQIHHFAIEKEELLRKYLELPNGIPSHDTIQRVFAMVCPEFLKQFQIRWNELLSNNGGEKLKKIFSLDGKTQRGSKRGGLKPNHIVSAVDENGFCFTQELVDDKSNEITAIPLVLKDLNIKGHIVTTDAMGCQKDIAALIVKMRADYVLALKANHSTLYTDVKLYFEDNELLKNCAYTKTVEKARSSIEVREYWQTEDISWIDGRKDWSKFKSIAMTRNTITKGGTTTIDVRYFISSLGVIFAQEDEKDKTYKQNQTADLIAKAIRSHWMVESYHHHLDVTFKEDANQTADKDAAFNLNIITKLAHNALKLLDVGRKNTSIRSKRFIACLNPEKYIDMLMEV
jgi:predicted transposase YbfD/YdcC